MTNMKQEEITAQFVSDYLEKIGCSLMTEYIDYETPIIVGYDDCGHNHTLYWTSIYEYNIQCMICHPVVRSSRMKKYGEVNDKISSNKGFKLLLSEEEFNVLYEGNEWAMPILCDKGDYFARSLTGYIRRPRCGICSQKNKADLFRLSLEEAEERSIDRGFNLITKDYENCKQIIEFECLICGETFNSDLDKLLSRVTYGCGCEGHDPEGETAIAKFLSDKGIEYISQFKFSRDEYESMGIVYETANRLRYDFAIKQDDQCIIIEYDGCQHFKASSNWGGDKALKSCEYRDGIKTAMCFMSKYPLLRISHNDINRLNELLSEFVFKDATIDADNIITWSNESDYRYGKGVFYNICKEIEQRRGSEIEFIPFRKNAIRGLINTDNKSNSLEITGNRITSAERKIPTRRYKKNSGVKDKLGKEEYQLSVIRDKMESNADVFKSYDAETNKVRFKCFNCSREISALWTNYYKRPYGGCAECNKAMKNNDLIVIQNSYVQIVSRRGLKMATPIEDIINMDCVVDVECKFGHTFKSHRSKLGFEKQCKACEKAMVDEVKYASDVKKLKNKGLELVGEYTRTDLPITVRCETCNNTFTGLYSQIATKRRILKCLVCYEKDKSNKKTAESETKYEEFKLILERERYQITIEPDEYPNHTTIVKCKCPVGHDHCTSYTSFCASKNRCKQCKDERMTNAYKPFAILLKKILAANGLSFKCYDHRSYDFEWISVVCNEHKEINVIESNDVPGELPCGCIYDIEIFNAYNALAVELGY